MSTILLSCDPPSSIGLPPLEPVGSLLTDTLTVRISTVLADSVRTGSPDRFLVGKYSDPLLGDIKASSYTWLSLTETRDLSKEVVYDSLNLYLYYSYVYGDSVPQQKVSVHRVTEDLSASKIYYSNSSINYDAIPLGSTSFKARPDSGGIVKVKIPGALGQELFTLLQTSTNQTNEILHKTLKGLALIPGDENTTIVGFDGSGFMSLFYHKTTADTVALTYNLFTTLSNSVTGAKYKAGFNKISSDLSGSVLSGIKPLQPVSSKETDGKSYIQDALGIMTKIEIPYLKDLKKEKPVIINRAQLTLKPDQTIVKPGLKMPQHLVLIETDATNKIKRNAIDYETVVNGDANGYNSLPVDPQIATFAPRTKDYTFYITTQLQAILTNFKKNDSFLLTPVYTNPASQSGGSVFFPQLLSNSVNRIAFSNKPEDIKLTVFYTQAGN